MAEKCQERVTAVKGDLDAARAEEDPSKVPPLLTAVAALYRDLHAECRASDLPVPEDAAIASNVDLVWREDDVLGADDLWTEFPNAGWSLVESLPGLPDGFARSYFLSLAEQQPAGGLTARAPRPLCRSVPCSVVCACGRSPRCRMLAVCVRVNAAHNGACSQSVRA